MINSNIISRDELRHLDKEQRHNKLQDVRGELFSKAMSISQGTLNLYLSTIAPHKGTREDIDINLENIQNNPEISDLQKDVLVNLFQTLNVEKQYFYSVTDSLDLKNIFQTAGIATRFSDSDIEHRSPEALGVAIFYLDTGRLPTGKVEFRDDHLYPELIVENESDMSSLTSVEEDDNDLQREGFFRKSKSKELGNSNLIYLLDEPNTILDARKEERSHYLYSLLSRSIELNTGKTRALDFSEILDKRLLPEDEEAKEIIKNQILQQALESAKDELLAGYNVSSDMTISAQSLLLREEDGGGYDYFAKILKNDKAQELGITNELREEYYSKLENYVSTIETVMRSAKFFHQHNISNMVLGSLYSQSFDESIEFINQYFGENLHQYMDIGNVVGNILSDIDRAYFLLLDPSKKINLTKSELDEIENRMKNMIGISVRSSPENAHAALTEALPYKAELDELKIKLHIAVSSVTNIN
jgi:hypothetical protein